TTADALKADQNKLGQQVGKLKRDLKGQSSAELGLILAQSNELKSRQQAAAEQQAQAEVRANEIMLQLPAIPDPTWPVGKDDSENVEIRKWADPQRPPLPLKDDRKDHIALGTALGILDFDRGVKLAGSRSYVLRGDGALLYHAVLRFAQDLVAKRAYEPFV